MWLRNSGDLSNSLSGASYANAFVYTHLGQLWQEPVNGTSSQKQYLYCTSQPHELTGIYSSEATCANKTTQVYGSSYDSWGNVTSRTYNSTTATLSYDLLDHFVNWNAGSSNKDLYVYDASGTRVLRRTTTSTGTTMTVYAFGLEEHSYFNAGGHKSDLYYYTVGGRVLGALDTTGKMVFYLTDALGSVLASFNTTANNAAIKGNQVYGPYGNPRDVQGAINTAKGFTGQYTDSLTGLDYYQSRYYDQVAGVFLSADIVNGNGSGENPYSYVGGNPETYTDPSGQAVIMPGGGGGIGLAAEAGVEGELGGGSLPDAYNQAFQGSPAPATDPTLSPDSVTLTTDARGDSMTYIYNPTDGSIVTLLNNGLTAGFTLLPNSPGYQQALDAYHAAMNPAPVSVNMAMLARLGFHAPFSGTTGSGSPQTQTGGGGQQPPINNRPPTAPPPEPVDRGNPHPKVTLYRAVGPSELNDLLRYGDYGLSPNQGGKYFALTEQGVWDFALSDFNSGIPMTVTSIEVPDWMLERGFIFMDPGGGGLSVHFEDDVLINDLYENMGLPKIIGAPWAGWSP